MEARAHPGRASSLGGGRGRFYHRGVGLDERKGHPQMLSQGVKLLKPSTRHSFEGAGRGRP